MLACRSFSLARNTHSTSATTLQGRQSAGLSANYRQSARGLSTTATTQHRQKNNGSGDKNQQRRGYSTSNATNTDIMGVEVSRTLASKWGVALATLLALGLYNLVAEEDKETEKDAQENESTRAKKHQAAYNDEAGPTVQTKYLIIGGGTAGYSALQAIRESDPDATVIIVTDENYTPYQRPPLTKELWASKDPEVAKKLEFVDWTGKNASLFYEKDESYSGNVIVLKGAGIALLNIEEREAVTKNDIRIKYDQVLIATGGTPFHKFAGDYEFGKDVTTFRDIDDYRNLDGLTRNEDGTTNILIAGGGFLGSELAWALSKKKNVKVTQVFPEAGTMANLFPAYLSEHVTKKLANRGVDIKSGRLVKNISGHSDKVTVTLDNDETLTADHVVLAAGIVPNTEFAELAGLEVDKTNKGLLVNNELQARQGVFVAGDVASYYDLFLGRRRVEHYEHASESGKLAGQNMVASSKNGQLKPYVHLPGFWGGLGPTGYEAVGDINAKHNTVGVWLKADNTPADDTTAPQDYKKGIVYYLNTNQQVVGVLLWNLYGKTDEARKAIRRTKSYTDLTQLKSEISLESDH